MKEEAIVADALAPVRKSVAVQTNAAEAFRIFTDDFDSWWPRSHHIGSSPMKRAVIEGHVGGRCYSEQEDGTDCPWGSILVWDPPKRFVFAWQIGADWKFQPNLDKSSEVEVRFIPVGANETRVELEHRGFERMETGGEAMRTGVNGEMGWEDLLKLYAQRCLASR